MSEGTALGEEWNNFLIRNDLICTKHCCTEVRWQANAKAAREFDEDSDEGKQEARESLQRVLDLEKAGARFGWTGLHRATLTVLPEPAQNQMLSHVEKPEAAEGQNGYEEAQSAKNV